MELWNKLPKEIKLCDDIDNFKKKLKTHLFSIANYSISDFNILLLVLYIVSFYCCNGALSPQYNYARYKSYIIIIIIIIIILINFAGFASEVHAFLSQKYFTKEKSWNIGVLRGH